MKNLVCVLMLQIIAGCFAWGQILPPVSMDDGPGNKPPAAQGPIMLRDSTYWPGNGVTAPMLVKAGSGHYSREALDAGYEVTALVEATIGLDGIPSRARAFAEFEKGLRIEAEEAVLQSKFEPGSLQGKPVAVHVWVAVSFKLEKGEPHVRVYQPGEEELARLQEEHRAYFQEHSGSGRFRGGQSPVLNAANRTRPVPIHTAMAEFTEEARKAKYGGGVLLSTLVTEEGVPSDIRVEKGLEMGLNEKAIEAMRQYRFQPGTENGRPVAMRIKVSINFHFYK